MSSSVRLGLWKKATSEKGPMPVVAPEPSLKDVGSPVPQNLNPTLTSSLHRIMYRQASQQHSPFILPQGSVHLRMQ